MGRSSPSHHYTYRSGVLRVVYFYFLYWLVGELANISCAERASKLVENHDGNSKGRSSVHVQTCAAFWTTGTVWQKTCSLTYLWYHSSTLPSPRGSQKYYFERKRFPVCLFAQAFSKEVLSTVYVCHLGGNLQHCTFLFLDVMDSKSVYSLRVCARGIFAWFLKQRGLSLTSNYLHL